MILQATIKDAKEILKLQKLAYISEAKLFDNMKIQPLTETLEEIEEEFSKGLVLKMDVAGMIVGSIRAYESNGTVYIGKLMVHPDYRGRGYGTSLLNEIENYFTCERFELFTSTRSVDNIRLYEANGYKKFKQEAVTDELIFVNMEKN